MQEDTPLKTLYQSLRDNNYDVPDNYDSFERTLTSDTNARQTLYQSLKDNNYDVPDNYDSFDRTLFPQPSYASQVTSRIVSQPQTNQVPMADVSPYQPAAAPNLRAPFANNDAQRQYEREQFKRDMDKKVHQLEEQSKGIGERFESNIEAVKKGNSYHNKEQRYNPATGKVETVYYTPQGEETTSALELADAQQRAYNPTAWAKKHNKVQVDDLIQSIDNQLEEAKGRATEQFVESEAVRNVTEKGTGVRRIGGAIMLGNTPVVRNMLDTQEVRDLTAAKRAMDNSRKIITEADHNANEGKFESSFAAGLGRGFGQKISDPSTWDMGVSDVKDNYAILDALNAWEEGKQLTPSQQALLDAKVVELATIEYFSGDLGRGYKAGGVTAESIPFMIEMICNPLSSAGKGAAKVLGKYAMKRFGRKALRKGINRAAVRGVSLLGHELGAAAGATGMTTTTGAVRTEADAVRRMTGTPTGSFDEDGNMHFDGVDNSNRVDEGTAHTQAAISNIITNFTEMFLPEGGFAAKKFLELTKKGAGTKAGKYIGLRAVNNFFTKAGKSKIGNTIIDLERQAQWHGGVEEFLEEIADGSMNAWLVGDQSIRGKDGKMFGTTDKDALFNQDNLIDTALGVGVMSLAFPFAKTLGYGYEKGVAPKIESFRYERNVKKMMRNADEAGLDAFGGDETAWGQLRNRLSMGTEEDVKGALLEVLGSDDYSNEQKIAARDYAVASQGLRLIDSMLEELRQDPDIDSVVEAYDNGYDADEQQRSDIAIEASEGKEGAEEAWNGVVQRIEDDADVMAAEQRQDAKVRSNKNDGAIHPATLKELDADGNPKEVFVVDGEFSMDTEGNISGGDVIVVYDPVDGKNREISPMEISSLGDVTTAEQQEQNIEANRQAYIQQQIDEVNGVVHVEPGYQFTTQDGEQAVVVAVNGDDIVYLLPDGRQEVTSLEAVQQIVDDARMEAYRMSHPETALQDELQPKGAPESFEPMMELTIRDDDGNEQTVVVTGGRARFTGKGYEDDPNGKFVELYVPGSEEPMYIHENELQKRTVDYKGAEQPKEEVAEGTVTGTQSVGEAAPVEPVGRNILGSVFDQFKGRAKEAIDFLLRRKEGDAVAALHHKDVGDIDLWYGNDTAGLKKIAEKHPEVLGDLQGIIDGMHVVSASENRVVLGSDTHKAVISKMLGNEKTDNWLLTAYEKKGTSASSSDIETEPEGERNGTAAPQNPLSDGKGTNNISTVQAMPMRTVSVGKGKDKQEVEEPDFMATTAQRGHQYIYNEKGYPREVADEMVQTRHGNAAKTLDELTKSEPKMSDSNIGGSMALYDNIHGEWQAKKQAAEQEVKYWEDVMAEQQKAIAAEQAAMKAQQQEQKEAEQGVPDMSVDKAADARRRGYRVSMGNRFDRQEPVQGMTGNETEIKFSDNDKVRGTFKVVDSQQVQPSHMRGQRNPLHFITEAQPKDRTDEVSDDKSSKMAKNINPKEITEGVTAYVGAPIINSRGEVIQGNNRAIALKKMPGYPESAAKYKQYLIDHAAEFGLNADEIAKMENPVLVREVDVADDEAIRLGQFTANDTESGGKQRMSAGNILGQLDDQKTKSLFNLLLETGDSDEDMTLDQIIDRNGTKVMTWLNRNGVINATQTQSAYDSKGHMTPEAKNDLKDLITHHIFKGGSDAIGEAWDKLPVSAQKALAVVMAGDLQLKPEDRLLPDVQNAIMVAGRIENTMPEEVKSARRASEAKKRLEEMEKVVKAATQQMDLTTNKPIISGYSDLDMKIAAEILSLNQSQIKAIFDEYQRYVLGTGGSLFGEATKMSRPEAVEKTFNVKDTRYGSETETSIAESGDGARAEQLGRGERPSQGAAAGQPAGEPAAAEQPAGEPIKVNGDEQVEGNIAAQEAERDNAEQRPVGAGLREEPAGEAPRGGDGVDIVVLGAQLPTERLGDFEKGSRAEQEEVGHHIIENAKRNGVFIKRSSLGNFGERVVGVSGESVVYIDEPNNRVVKVKDPFAKTNLKGHAASDALYEHIAHNLLFPNTKYKLLGISEGPVGDVRFVLEQDYLPTSMTPATQEQIDKYLVDNLGLTKLEKPYLHYENDDYSITDVDAGNDNVLADEDGTLYFVDPIIKFKKPAKEVVDHLRGTDAIAAAEAEVNTNPTEAQKEAGNYKMGHVKVDGYDITIENPKGSTRSGVDPNGKAWEQEMHNTYGYIRGTEGVDGDHIDVFLSDDPSQGDVFVVDQVNEDGSFDEHKVMYGFGSVEEAREAYLSNYEDGWQGLGAITPVSKEEFKKWIESSHRKTKPFSEYKSVETLGDVDMEQPKQQKAVADIESSGAVVDKLQDMGVEVSTDIAENRRVRKQAEQDNSEAGKIHNLKNSDGKVYGFAYRGKLYLDPRKMNAELPLHEYGHLWTEAFRILNPEGWNDVVETIKQDAKGWEMVKELYPDLKTDSEIADEVIATFSGKNGAEKLKAELERMAAKNPEYKSRWGNIYNNIVKAIQDFWKKVGDFLGIKYETPEQVYDQVLRDFAAGINPRARVEEYLKERDDAYMKAAESGDVEKATEIFNKALGEEVGNGMTPFVSVGNYFDVRDLARKVKARDPQVIQQVAEMMAPLIPDNAVLVPAPSHSGTATDMLDLAKAIAKIKGCVVADVLMSAPRESQYKTKKESGQPITAAQMGITMNGTLPDGKVPVLIDNVVDSGNTAEACVKALGKGIVVSLGNSADMYGHAATLKSAAPILKGRNGKIVPLSKRFDLGGSQYLGRSMQQKVDNSTFNDAVSKLEDSGISIDNSELLEKYGLKNVTLEKRGNHVTMTHFIANEQGKGNGTRFMQDLADIADRNGWTLALTPDDSFGASSVKRLKDFYKRFGFKDNKGRNSDFETRESMVRQPQGTTQRDKAILGALVDKLREFLGKNRVITKLTEAEKAVIDWANSKMSGTAPVFYSNAEKAVEDIKQEKATAEQWLSMIQNAGGLKAGEDKWMGLSDWLNDHKGESLTKQMVLDFIRENQIGVQEVEYSDSKMPNNFAYNLRNELNEKADEICGDVSDEYADMIAKAEDFSDELDDIEDDMMREARRRLDDEFGVPTEHYISIQFENDRNRLVYTPTRSDRDFSNNFAQQVWNQRNGNEGRPINETRLQYTTKGLENKREIALVVPSVESWNEGDDVHFGDAGNGRAVAWVRFGDAYMPADGGAARQEFERIMKDNDEWYAAHPMFAKYGIADKGESLDALNKESEERKSRQREALAAADAVPKTVKVLVIDEIQSKRHQEGREKGYKTKKAEVEEEKLIEAVEKAQEAYDDFTRRMGDKYNGAYEDIYADMTDAEQAEAERLEKEVSDADERFQNHNVPDVPDAPFEKNWHELAMKRMLRYAAENGYDKVAWTKGEQQKERYDLSNVLQEVWKNPEESNENQSEVQLIYKNIQDGWVRIDHESRKIVAGDNEALIGESADNVFGTAFTDRIIEMAGDEYLKANDISIGGGEGMKGFYDQMLPRFMDKYGKKWGVKTGEVELPNLGDNGLTMWSVDVTPDMKRSVMEGQPMFHKVFHGSGGRDDNAKNYVIFDDNDLKITDKVKFFKTPQGEVYGFTVGGKIYIDMDIAKADTAVHEYTHLWVPMVKESDPKMWQEIKDVLTKDKDVQPFMEIVRQRYPELTQEGREDDFMEEVLAHFSGAKGLERLEEAAREYEEQDGQGLVSKAKAMVVLNKVKSALEKFWGKVAQLFGIKFRNAQEIADKVLSDLLHSVDPTAVRNEQSKATDKAYMEAVEKGDMETAQRMVVEEARKKGYISDAEYRMSHTAPNGRDGFSKSIDNPEEIYPDDLYSTQGYHYYGDGDRAMDIASWNVFKRIHGNPDAMVKVYRAVPKSLKETKLRNGDWVSVNKAYAQEHGERNINGAYKIIEDEVPAKHIFTDGNSLHEQGYDDGNEYVYQNTKNNRKLLDAVTYDDNGNVIPLSKRFNKRNADIRYQKVGGDEDDGRSVQVVKAEKEHGFTNFAEARRWAKKNIVGEYENPEIGSVNISGTAVDKYLSEKAVVKSDNKDVHLSALKVMPSIIENSIVGEVHDDKNGSENVRDIVRLYGAIDIDGQPYRVKTTVKRYNNENEKTKAYSYEVTEIELLEGTHGDDINNPLPRTTNNSISAAKLLQNIKTSKNNSQYSKNENGEQLQVSESPEEEYSYWDMMRKLERGGITLDEALQIYETNREDIGAIEEGDMQDSVPDLYNQLKGQQAALRQWLGDKADTGKSVATVLQHTQPEQQTYVTGNGVQLNMDSLLYGTEHSDVGDVAEPALSEQLTQEQDITGLRLRKLAPGETCHVERRYEENKQFDFTGKEKIETMDDVAYIFKQLETAAVENTFLAMVKDGRPIILHVGMGGYTSSPADARQALAAYIDMKPDKVYFVHNHPSGTLKASREDRNTLQRMREMFGTEVVQDGIIIDTVSGKYGIFGYEGSSENDMPESNDDNVPIKTYEFSKLVFSPEWNPQEAFKITDSSKVAEFISSHRLGEHKKMSFIVLDNQLNVVGNFFLPWTKLSDINDNMDAVRVLSNYVNLAGGTTGCLYGNYEYDIASDHDKLKALAEGMSIMGTKLTDIIHVSEGDDYHSAMETGVMEPVGEYDTVNMMVSDPSVDNTLEPFNAPAKEQGEEMADYAKRVADAYRAYKEKRKKMELKETPVEPFNAPAKEKGEDMVSYAKRVADAYREYEEKRKKINTEEMLDDDGLSMRERMTEVTLKMAERNKDDRLWRDRSTMAIGGNLADLRKAMRAQKNYDRSTTKRVSDLSRMLIQFGYLDELSKGEVKRLLSAVKNATGKEELQGSVSKIMDIMVDNQLRRAEERMRDVENIKGSKIDTKGVEVQGALDVEGQEIVKAFKSARKMERKEIENSIDEEKNRMGSPNNAIAETAAQRYKGLMLALEFVDRIRESKEDELKLRDLLEKAHQDYSAANGVFDSLITYKEYVESVKEAIRQNKADRLEAYGDFMQRLGNEIYESAKRAQDFKDADVKRIREIYHNANSDMEGRPSDEHYKPKFADKFVNNSFVQFLFSPLSTFDQMLRLFGSKSANGEGYLYNRFMRGWVEAREKEIRGVREKYAVLDAKVKSLFGTEAKNMGKLIRKIGNMPKMNVEFWDGGKMKEHTLTQGNLMYIYMVNKMTDGRMKLRKMGINEEAVQKITDALDPRLIEFADWMQEEFLTETRNEYNETHKRMFGAPMASIENYFPLKINQNARTQREEELDQQDWGEGITTATGAIKKRTVNNTDLDLLNADALNVMLNHVAEMEHWNAFAEYNRDLNTLRTYKHFRNQVKNMTTIYGSGDELWKKFNKVAQMAAGSYRPPKADLDAAAVNFAKGVTVAKVSFRTYTALKQFLSMPAYIPDARPDLWVKNLATPWESWIWAMDNLPIFEERWKSRMAGDPRLLKSELDWKGWRNNIVQLASKIGMSPNAFVDALTASIGAKTIYETRKARYLKEGYNEEQADKKAKQDAEVAYNQTQQSSEGVFLSPMQVDRSWLSVMFTVFRNSSMAYQRQLHDALRNLKRDMKKGNKAESVEFMAKQMEREGVDADKAQEAAEKRYNRQIGKDVLRVATFGYILQLAWNLGAKLPYLLFGDDDEKKKEMMDDAWAQSMFGWGEGLTGGDVFSLAGKMAVEGKGNPEYLSKEMPIASDIKDVLQEIGNGKYGDVVNDMVNLAVQIGIGVNPQSITDAVLAVMDACGDDPALAHEAMIALMRILQVPQSQIKEMYFDEIGMTGEEASHYTPEQLVERYAQYQVKRGRLIEPWTWADESSLDKQREQATKVVKERVDRFGGSEVNEAYERLSDGMQEWQEKEKSFNKAKKEDYAKAAEVMAEIQKDPEGWQRYQRFKMREKQLNAAVKAYMGSETADEAQANKQKIEDLKKQMVEELQQ